MTAANLPEAHALWAVSDDVELAEGDSLEELRRYLHRNTDTSQVAVREGALVGALLAGHDGRRAFIYHLAIKQVHRGRGLGRAMVQRALELLQQQGIRRTLILVSRDNANGRAFWQRIGWEGLEFAEPMGIDL